jgi:hypothetical protein
LLYTLFEHHIGGNQGFVLLEHLLFELSAPRDVANQPLGADDLAFVVSKVLHVQRNPELGLILPPGL